MRSVPAGDCSSASPGSNRSCGPGPSGAGAEVLEGYEVTDVDQDPDGVTVTVSETEGTRTRRIRAGYLVGADGAHSRVREILGIPFEGRGVFSNSITIYFTADLWPQMGGKPLSVIYINNPSSEASSASRRTARRGSSSSTRSTTWRTAAPPRIPASLA